jgi:flavodoxin
MPLLQVRYIFLAALLNFGIFSGTSNFPLYVKIPGNAARYASDLGAILRSSCNVSFVDACGVNAAEDMLKVFPLIHAATLVIFVSSTQGNGELPSLARKFFAMLFGKHGNLLSGKHCAVLGFGSSSYPIFCGAASQLSTMLAKVNANEVVPHGKCDSVKGEALSFYDWTTNLVAKMATMRGANPLMLKLSSDIKDGNASSLVRARNMVHYVKVEVFTAKEVETAAAMSYMTQRRGSMGTISRRRISMDSIDSSERSSIDSSGRRRSSIDSSGRASGRRISFEQFLNGENLTPHERIMRIMSASSMRPTKKDILEGQVKSREDIISCAVKGEGSVTRKTSLIKIDLKMCGGEFVVHSLLILSK